MLEPAAGGGDDGSSPDSSALASRSLACGGHDLREVDVHAATEAAPDERDAITDQDIAEIEAAIQEALK